MHDIISVNNEMRNKIADFFSENWGAPIIVTRGKIHTVEDVQGYAVIIDEEIKSLITYCIEKGECEIVSLDSQIENQGIGTSLIEKVIETAKEHQCKRVWLITTNDNIKAIRFYQRRGFNIAGLYINAIQESRRIKPQIPLYGFDEIPILHEIEFEKVL
jgi:ribosomal protein S18 acetylase RimI-like enzyme